MILNALYSYYDRLNVWQKDLLPPVGFEDREIGFIIVIDEKGNYDNIEDFNAIEERRTEFRVMQYVERTSNAGKVAYVFWDYPEYVVNLDETTIAETQQEKNLTFISKVNEISQLYPNNVEFLAVSKFYQKQEFRNERLLSSPEFKRLIEEKDIVTLMSFRVLGKNTIVAENPDLLDYFNYQLKKCRYGTCFVTGKFLPLAETASIVRFFDGQPKAKLLSYNINSANVFEKTNLSNFPISIEADSKIYNALKHLLRMESDNKQLYHQLSDAYVNKENRKRHHNSLSGNRTLLFWASSNNILARNLEDLAWLLTMNQDIPNLRVDQIKALFSSIREGSKLNLNDDKFYFLGLAPNTARIAVVYWRECTLREFAVGIEQHFIDTEICDYRINEGCMYQGMNSMLRTIVKNNEKISDVFPNLPESLLKSLLDGNSNYPEFLYQACMSRIHAEREVKIERAAIIKGYLNRKYKSKIITKMLNKEETNIGYLCGRLFAVFERAQELSNKDENYKSTLRERFFSVACSSPQRTFLTLVKLSIYYYSKIDNHFKVEELKSIEDEIMKKIDPKGIPNNLNIDDQGRFVVGYYHQRGVLRPFKVNSKEINTSIKTDNE